VTPPSFNSSRFLTSLFPFFHNKVNQHFEFPGLRAHGCKENGGEEGRREIEKEEQCELLISSLYSVPQLLKLPNGLVT